MNEPNWIEILTGIIGAITFVALSIFALVAAWKLWRNEL